MRERGQEVRRDTGMGRGSREGGNNGYIQEWGRSALKFHQSDNGLHITSFISFVNFEVSTDKHSAITCLQSSKICA